MQSGADALLWKERMRWMFLDGDENAWGCSRLTGRAGRATFVREVPVHRVQAAGEEDG
jgi:hypothetical protein